MQRHRYLLHLQYLGYRYHGWLRQPDLKTVGSMVEKTAHAVFGHTDVTIVGASRTDAMVSAHHGACILVIPEAVSTDRLLAEFNTNLPNDIRILRAEEVDGSFNIITASRIKEYLYFFSFGEKPHPFSAPLICTVPGELDIPLMKEGAALFTGVHDFRRYCSTPKPGTDFIRKIETSEIDENTLFTANFFPDKSYMYRITSQGFMRHQVRLIMGQLLRLGRHETDLESIRETLSGPDTAPLRTIAPASGLMLYDIRFG